MAARVFISCGQHTDEERQTAARVKDWFHAEGFEPYVAITENFPVLKFGLRLSVSDDPQKTTAGVVTDPA